MRRLFTLVVSLLLAPVAAQATPITIDPGASLASNAAALAAFNRAANAWGAIFSDPIAVHINANLVNIAQPTVLGKTSSVMLQAGYTTVRNQMVLDAADEADDYIVSALPTAAEVSAFAPANMILTSTMFGTKANLKAMGFTGLDEQFGLSDASIEFNSNFTFDYDRSDGIGAGLIDFESVATHEIAHALGFATFVDEIDALVSLNLPGNISFMPMDLFRFGAAPGFFPTTVAEFTSTPRLLVPGAAAVFDDVSFSWALSTGTTQGDGHQASHWKDDVLTGTRIGVMDPTLAAAFVSPISIADVRALDVIGWDVQVPEPSSILLLGAGLALVLRRRARS